MPILAPAPLVSERLWPDFKACRVPRVEGVEFVLRDTWLTDDLVAVLRSVHAAIRSGSTGTGKTGRRRICGSSTHSCGLLIRRSQVRALVGAPHRWL